MLTKKQITQFRKTVYAYYQKNKRALPWRKNINPYRVVVSEVMLQQTQVDRVIPKFNAFIKQFPTFESLALAPLSLVLKLWSGLGYNRRAVNLQRLAKIIVGAGSPRPGRMGAKITLPRKGGETPPLPQTTADWDALPGIGPATAAAICVYAFNLPYPFIETNVRAVFIHHFFSSSVGARHALPLQMVSDTDILPLVEQTMDTKNPREWFWALMDYGTYLKKQYQNPARHSAHHTKQSKFEGSVRQVRGAVVRALIKNKKMTEHKLCSTLNKPKMLVHGCLAAMKREGLVINKNASWMLAS